MNDNEPREEPNCGDCHDSREVWVGPGSGEPTKVPCPMCSPPNPNEPVF